MSSGSGAGLVGGLIVDLKRLHETWMEIRYPRQLNADQSVLGKWKPTTTAGTVAYRTWAAIGALVIAMLYPLVLAGYVIRYQAIKLDTLTTRIGLIGVVVLAAIVWGALSLIVKFELGVVAGGVIAVMVASVVAVLAAGGAYLSATYGGRVSTVAIAYPLAVTAFVLPPVVAALFYQPVYDVIEPTSASIAAWGRANVLAPLGVKDWVVRRFDLEGATIVVLWLLLSVPVGWLLGLVATLAAFVRAEE
ncbi:MAG: hypothetical protein ABEJ86_00290 [Halococcoides sp.]